ncbi:DUF1524 domain-containing protein [Plesiomonas shigelloides]|nr:DUF1524 domain-containing protein [Plesiomonas shigelloides]
MYLNITVVRPLLLSALRFRAKKPRSLTQSDLISLFKEIERFHFRFNAICKERPSGIDSAYSALAVAISKANDKRAVRSAIDDVKSFLERKTPATSIFNQRFEKDLWYTNDKPNHKKLIFYIFKKLELAKRITNELSYELVSIEHIGSQANYNAKTVGMIGNLLPLGFAINEKCKTKAVTDKIDYYKSSDLLVVKEFTDSFSGEWNESDIISRTQKLAHQAYELI